MPGIFNPSKTTNVKSSRLPAVRTTASHVLLLSLPLFFLIFKEEEEEEEVEETQVVSQPHLTELLPALDRKSFLTFIKDG